jgi:hypothetical protein
LAYAATHIRVSVCHAWGPDGGDPELGGSFLDHYNDQNAHIAPSTLRAAIDMLNPKTAADADFGQPVGNAVRK